MSLINQKSNKFHSEIRKEQISTIMKKIRYDIKRQNDEATLNNIINLPNQDFTMETFEILVQMVNSDTNNAIIHLANLVIDRFLTKEILANVVWTIGNNEKWTFMINAFAEIGFCTPEMFEHCVRRIIHKKSNFNLENALQMLQKSFKTHPESIQYFSAHSQLILALCNHIYDTQDKISLKALTILSTTTSENESIPKIIFSVAGQTRLNNLLKYSFTKISTVHRALGCQIANNFLLSGVHLQNFRLRLLHVAESERERVKLEISYYLKGFVEVSDEDTILFYIKRYRLLQILRSYSKICSQNPRYDHQIIQNAVHSIQIIVHRFSQVNPYQTEKHALAQSISQWHWQDESERHTICQEPIGSQEC